ncbi:MAG TPA: tryptophan synthase subunit alpha [Acidimicrobiales bacterium]|nr:tryptophan synthase subunit alpha [Acidimicrobiales bacterium]
MTDHTSESHSLESHLRATREKGRKLLVPYVTGGLDDEWLEVVRALAMAGADAIEVGIPFSDPVMDGPIIQAASVRALERGVTPESIISALTGADIDVPIVVMTYVNLIAHAGYRRMANRLAEAGVAGAILPDLPVDEAGEWLVESAAAGIDSVLLAAPTSSDARLELICANCRGFVYGVGLMGVTGVRSELSDSAKTIARRLKAVTDLPVLIGVGVSNTEQAVEISEIADGVVVGSALVRRLLDGEGSESAADFIGSIREALDKG